MKSGYDQFFKKAQSVSTAGPASVKKKIKVSSDSQIAEILRGKLREPQVKLKKKRHTPWKLIITSALGFTVAVAGYLNLDAAENLMKNVEISLIGEASAEAAPAAPQTAAASAAPADAQANGVKQNYTQEELDHFAKLNDRKRELDLREEELNRMETELQAQKVEIEKKLSELGQTRTSISNMLEQRVQVDEKKVETLVQMYSNMKAQQAAKVFETMDEDLAVEIIGKMKKKNAAEVMNLIKAEKAQILSERIAGYKRAPSNK